MCLALPGCPAPFLAGRLDAALGPGRVLVEAQGHGIVNTVGYITPREDIVRHLTPDGAHVANADGSIAAVVHQYDRFPLLRKLLKP